MESNQRTKILLLCCFALSQSACTEAVQAVLDALPNSSVNVSLSSSSVSVIPNTTILNNNMPLYTHCKGAAGFSLSSPSVLSQYGAAASTTQPSDPIESVDVSLTNPVWQRSGLQLITARSGFLNLKLQDGRTLIVGGYDVSSVVLDTAEIMDSTFSTSVSAGKPNADGFALGAGVATSDGNAIVGGGVNRMLAQVSTVAKFDASNSTWQSLASMTTARSNFSMVQLANGKILAIGGLDGSGNILSSVEIYDPTANTWQATGSLNVARSDFAAVALSNGKVLVAGGTGSGSSPLASVEIFDPGSMTFSVVGSSLSVARTALNAIKMQSGKVMISGGAVSNQARPEVDIYDPTSNSVQSVSAMTVPRKYPSLVLKADGVVYAVAGCSGGTGPALRSVEFYDPVGNKWSTLGAQAVNRSAKPVQFLLPNAKMLSAGGDIGGIGSVTSEVMDLNTGKVSATNALSVTHTAGCSLKLNDGRIFVSGGAANITSTATTKVTEVFDASTSSWSVVAPMNVSRAWHACTLMSDGKVFVVGGKSGSSNVATTEIYDPVANTWTNKASLNFARSLLGIVTLNDGRFLVAGGASNKAEIYDPSSDTWTSAANITTSFLSAPEGVLLPDGKVLFVSDNSSSIYDPSLNTWTAGGALVKRFNGISLLNLNSALLIFGGSTVSQPQIFDVSSKTWRNFANLKNPRWYSRPVVTDAGKIILNNGEASNDLALTEVMTTTEVVSTQIAGGTAPYSVTIQSGGGYYDSSLGLFYPPLNANSGASLLRITDANGKSTETTINYGGYLNQPGVLTAVSSALDFGSNRVKDSNSNYENAFTVNLNYIGALPATGLRLDSGMTSQFDYVGAVFPGTGGTCTSSITSNCTLKFKYGSRTAGAFTATPNFVYTSGTRGFNFGLSFSGSSYDINPAEQVLILYNSNSADSIEVKNYYLANRPLIGTANVLGLSSTSDETISDADYINTIETPVVNWLLANPNKKIRYIIMMYDLPTITYTTDYNGIPYRLSRCLQTRKYRSGTEYNQVYQEFDPTVYRGTTALVSNIAMGSVAASKAYIDKLKRVYNQMANPSLVISARNGGTAGSSYYIDEANAVYADITVGLTAYNQLTSAVPTVSAVYAGQTASPLTNNANVSGFFSWGTHAGFAAEYATNGQIVFTGNSDWYVIITVESFNGWRAMGSQGNITRWYSSNSFGGTGSYEHTPAGAASHLVEPYATGANNGYYFAMWEKGYLQGEGVWSSRMTPYMMNVGDPLIVK